MLNISSHIISVIHFCENLEFKYGRNATGDMNCQESGIKMFFQVIRSHFKGG
jgi:hypothetical protein